LIPPYLAERFTLLPPEQPVDNSQNPLYMVLNGVAQTVLGDATTT
jgi:hypothetical protein